jgi:hypothetical protein
MLWRVDLSGNYTATWQVPEGQLPGPYRIVVTANHYRLVSAPFSVTPATTLSVDGTKVRNPDLVVNADLTYRPTEAVGGRLAMVAGTTVPPGGAVDAYGNCNGAPASTTSGRSGADPSASPSVCARYEGARTVATQGGTPPVTGALPSTGSNPSTAPIGWLLLAGAALTGWWRRSVTEHQPRPAQRSHNRNPRATGR